MNEINPNPEAGIIPQKPAKPLLQFTRAELISVLLMLVLGYLCVKLVLAGGQGLGVSVFTLLFTLALLYWFRKEGRAFTAESLAYLALILITGAYFALYDNRELKSLSLLLLPLLIGYFIAAMSGSRLEARSGSYLLFDLADSLLARPLSQLDAGPRLLKSAARGSQKGRGALLLLLGLVLAIPVCVVVSALLQSADAAFSTLWQRLSDSFLRDIVTNAMQFIVGIPLACYFFAALKGGQKPRRSEESAQKIASAAHFLPGLLVIGGITPLLLIYVLFFCSQTAYFLSAFSGLLPEGYIYAEYARRGFFELCAVSGLNFAAIFVLSFLSKKTPAFVYRLYTVLLSLFSLALIAISLRKMLLYIQIYGLTPLRVYTSWAMLLLALLFIFVIIKTWRPRFNAALAAAVATVAMFLILCFANPDAQIARYNVRGFAEGRLQQLDVEALSQLGAAAVPYLLEVTTMEQAGADEREWANQLLQRQKYILNNKENDWRAFNLASWRADKMIRENSGNSLAGVE